LNKKWFSPEEALHVSRVTEKIDVYALGNIFFYILTGTQPWKKIEIPPKPSSETVIAAKVAGKLPSLPQLNEGNPVVKVLLDVMYCAYTTDPASRPTAHHLAMELQKVLNLVMEEIVDGN